MFFTPYSPYCDLYLDKFVTKNLIIALLGHDYASFVGFVDTVCPPVPGSPCSSTVVSPPSVPLMRS